MIGLSIVIVSFNTKEFTIRAIESVIKNTKDIEFEIIVIDNNSTDGSLPALRKLSGRHKNLILKENKVNSGFAAGNNQGYKAAQGKYVLFLNSDTEVTTPILAEIIDWMDSHEEVGFVTCALKNKDGSVQATGGYFPTLLRVFSWMTIQDIPFVDSIIKPFHPLHQKSSFSRGEDFYKKARELDWVTGAFLLTRKAMLEKVGGWDEKYFMYVEEVDLCFRIKRLGYRAWYLPEWSIIHFGGASAETKESSLISEFNGIKRFYKKFYPRWQFPILRFLLKLGAAGRIVLFGILEGSESAKTYAKIFESI